MLIVTIVLLSFLLIASIIGNVILFLNAESWKSANDLNEKRIVEVKVLAQKVYTDIKSIDDREMFARDDDVGVVFEDMVSIIKYFNEVVQEVDQIEEFGELEKE